MPGQMMLAYAIARYRKMLQSNLNCSQRQVVRKYGDQIMKHLSRLDPIRQERVLSMAGEFSDIA